MTRRQTIWIIGIVLLVGALLLTATIYRDSLGREIVNSALRDTGYVVTELSVDSLSSESVRLSGLAIQHHDGTRIVVEGATLPLELRERRIDTLSLDFVQLIPPDSSVEAPSYAELVQLGVAAYRLVPDVEIRVGVLQVPWLPDLTELVWQTTQTGQTIGFDIDAFAVNASAQLADEGHAVSLAVNAADGDEALSWEGSAVAAGPDIRFDGAVQASAGQWTEVLHALGAMPEELRTLSGQVYGNVSALVEGKPGGAVKFAGTLWSDGQVDASYVTQDGSAYRLSGAGLDELQWSFAYPSLDWTASLALLQSSVRPGAASPLGLQLSGVECRSGTECRLVAGYSGRGLTRDNLSLALVELSAPLLVEIGESVTVRSTRPATVHLERLAYGQWQLASVDLSGEISLVDSAYSAKLTFQAGDGVTGEAEAVFDDERREGTLELVNARVDFATRNASAIFARWPLDWDVVDGHLRAKARLELEFTDAAVEPKGTIEVELSELAGSYGDLAFAGLNSTAAARLGSSSALEVRPFEVRLALFDIGFPAENIELRIAPDFADREISIESARAQTLGGSLAADPFVYSLAAEVNQLVLRPDGIQLQLIADLVDSEALIVEGSVSGEIPLSVTEQGITADGGQVESDAPGGAIRFPSGIPGLVATDDNSQVGIVTRALSNFEFDLLTSDVTYTADGDLLLQMRMEGVNPDMDPNQPVVLNLGLENNVPELLKSLQAARSISDILGRKFAN